MECINENKTINVLEIIIMARPKSKTKDLQVKSIGNVDIKCAKCGVSHSVDLITYSDDTTSHNPQHGRCAKCQTIHLCNLRMAKYMTACKHLGNMKLRLNNDIGKEAIQAVIAQCEETFSDQVVGRLTGDVIVACGFDLAKIGKDEEVEEVSK